MAVEVTMPKFGLTMHEATVQRFFKAVGEIVAAGEPLFEVETEKVLYEVEAPASGNLALRLPEDGESVACGGLVAVIAEPGEDRAAVAARYASSAERRDAPAPAATATAAQPDRPSPGLATERRPASPVARKLAAELGVDLARLSGSGPGGRITRDDVERAAAAPGTIGAKAPSPAAPPHPRGTAAAVPLRGIRKTIAERMRSSLATSAQLTITMEADVSDAVAARERIRTQLDFTYTDLAVHAAARALARHPRMNARMGEREIQLLDRINLGIAVALDDGLIVPVIFDADKKSLAEIAAESRALGERARAGRLRLEDVTGGTFTVSNLGLWGVDAFTPILNPGETGILGLGRIAEKPAIFRGEIARRSMLTFSLTFDHQVIDGAPAAAFLSTVIDLFNHPAAWTAEQPSPSRGQSS